MLKSFVALCSVLLLALISDSFVSAAERDISWTEDYEAAVQRAAAADSVLLLHFYGDHCPPCKLLDKKTFQDPALVAKMNDSLVPVKINADRRRDLALKYNVTRWPTDVYLFPNGEEIYRGISNQDPAVYCKTISRVSLRHRDWTLERNSIARANEKRQDRALAANTPQIQSERTAYSGSAGHSVRTHSAAWANPAGLPQSHSQNQQLPVAAPIVPRQRIIENPYYSKQPIVVPPAPGLLPAPSQPTVPESAQRPAPILQSPVAPSPSPSPPTPSAQNQFAQNPSVQAPIGQSNVPPVPQQLPPATPSAIPSAMPPPAAEPQHSPATRTAATTPAQPVSSQRSVTPSEPTDEPKQIYAETIGLEGFCPVTLIESMSVPNANGWVAGNASFAVRHRGRIYHCASERARRTLLSAPDQYTPCLSSFDLIHFVKAGTLIDGKNEFGCVQEGTNRIFLFATKENGEEFKRNSDYYSRLIDGASTERVANESTGTQIR